MNSSQGVTEAKTIPNRHVEDAVALTSVQTCRPSLHPFRHTSDFKPIISSADRESGGNSNISRPDDDVQPQHSDKSDRLSSKRQGSVLLPILAPPQHPPCLTARQASLLPLLEDLSSIIAAQSTIESRLRAMHLASRGSRVGLYVSTHRGLAQIAP
jgi:hypothetical protein